MDGIVVLVVVAAGIRLLWVEMKFGEFKDRYRGIKDRNGETFW